jgi:hypothetical protein
MRHIFRRGSVCILAASLLAAGCASPSHTEEGTLFGGLLGAGTGAIIGHAAGNTAAGAAIGAGVGALSGAAIGAGQDQVEARNRAAIERQIGRQMAGAVHIDDVVAMTRAGVQPELIMNHIRAHGMAAPLQAPDLIMLQQQGVDGRVIATMQATPVPCVAGQPVIVQEAGPPPVVVEGYYGRPYYYHHPHRYYW